LQWFRLLRGSHRLNQIAAIFVELAPAKVFDPRDVYAQYRKQEKLAEVDTAEMEQARKMSGHAKKKMSKADEIKAKNQARLDKEAAKRDEEKLTTLRSKARVDVKLQTESGKLLLLLDILKTAVREQNVVDVLDTLWEVEDVIADLGEDDEAVKNAVKKSSDVLTLARKMRMDKNALQKLNLVDFQLTEMSDRLPPLNLHALSGKFRLDAWQLKVIQLIEQRKSVLITAPTSSGKTVVSSFVCATGSRVLFVVPTEPLAWQVAAMLRALKLGICLVVPTLSFVPPTWDVVVGTPHALESVLTKQLDFNFDYAVFDEVHSLNNRDGEALQRLIAAMPTDSCRFLALSATIGNGPQLATWFEELLGKGQIELVEHRSRFINLQRHVWTGTELKLLHPLVCMSTKLLAETGFAHTDMALTPVDAYKLWQALDKYVGSGVDEGGSGFDVSDLKPRKFFKDDPRERITLAQAHGYEMALKARLEKLARERPELCDKVLAAIASGESLKRKKKKDDDDGVGAAGDEPAGESIDALMDQAAKVGAVEHLVDLAFTLHNRKHTPCITFQLDSVKCQALFYGMLRQIEERENKKYPEYRSTLQKQQRGLEKLEKEKKSKPGKRGEDADKADEEDQVAQEFGEVQVVDVDAPHPEFTLATPGKGLGLTEANQLRERLRDDLPSTGDVAHPLIRALRRGVGVYVEGLPTSYHREVQSLAQRGSLGVVFSDELLAYGVNMPFRTAVFFGDPGRHWLTPLLHQQMAGRAGRRGLDRQGHLVYAGFTPARLQELLRGELPDVVGRFPLYPTVPLQLLMNERYKAPTLTEEKMHVICRTPLKEFLAGQKVEGYYDIAQAWVETLGITRHPASSYSDLVPMLVWELRQFLPESAALEYLLEKLIRKYKNVEVVGKGDKDSKEQYAVMLIFCRICAREPLKDDMPDVSWYGALPSPHVPDDDWNEWSAEIAKSQARITDAALPYKEQLLLPVPLDAPLDNMPYASFVRNQIDPALPTPMQHRLRERIFNVGEIMRITSNIMGRSAELTPVQNLIRKCFIRIRYILDETFERNWTGG